MSQFNEAAVPERQSPQLVMVKEGLDDLPRLELPAGYRLRSYWAGAGKDWNQIVATAFGWDPAAEDHFETRMRPDPAFRPQRVLFILRRRKVVATASAWHEALQGEATGTVHFVAVDPGERGRALGRLISLAALHQMKAEGRTRARLQTDDDRIPAIKSYLKLGFVPELIDSNQKMRWQTILRHLDSPELTRQLRPFLSEKPKPPPEPPATQRLDHLYGYEERRRHNPSRTERGGPMGGGDPDFLADESLYPCRRLGTASLSACEVLAGSPVRSGFTLSYTAGEETLPAGTELRWMLRGQGVLGFGWQTEDPAGENFVALETSEGLDGKVTRDGAQLGFRIAEGCLQAGDTVRLVFRNIPRGKKSRFGNRWNPVAARRRIYVEIRLPGNEPARRLSAPLEINFLPQKPVRAELLLPCTHSGDGKLLGSVTIRDRFDNRVTGFSGKLDLHTEGGTVAEEVFLAEGRGRFQIAREKNSPALRVESKGDWATVSNPSVFSEDLQYFLGDLHCHDLLSESEGYPDEVYAFARDDRRLDFFSLAVQSHGWHSNEKHALHKFFNERFNESGRFATLLAFEWQHSAFGDKVVHYLGGDQPYLPVEDPRFSSPAALYEALHGSDAFIISHHVAYPVPGWVSGTDWRVVDDRIERCVEIWSCHGSSEGYDPDDRPLRRAEEANTAYAALRRGLRLGFVGGSDSHSGRPGGAVREPGPFPGGLAAVWAPTLDRASIYEGLRRRHTCALTGARIVLRMSVNGLLMGSEAPAARQADIRIAVDAPGRIEKIEILKNTRVLKTFKVRGTEAQIEFEDLTGGPAFYHCRVTQRDGHLAVGSPVWVG